MNYDNNHASLYIMDLSVNEKINLLEESLALLDGESSICESEQQYNDRVKLPRGQTLTPMPQPEFASMPQNVKDSARGETPGGLRPTLPSQK